MRFSHLFLGTRRIWVFEGISVFKTIWVYIPCKKHSYLEKIALESIWSRMLLTQIITRVYKDSLTLTYPPTMNIWLVLEFWYLRVGSLIPLMMLFIDTMHSPIYQTNTSAIAQRFLWKLPSQINFGTSRGEYSGLSDLVIFIFLFSCDCVFGRVELLHMWFAGCWETAASLHGIACWPLKTTSPLSSAWVFVSFRPRNNLGHISSKLTWPKDFSRKY